MAELKRQGHWCARHHASGMERAGLQDVEASVFGRFVAIEFKDSFQKWKEWTDWTPAKAPNQTIATQREVQSEVRAAGGIHITVWRWAEIQIVIDEIAAGTDSKAINALVDAAQEKYREEH